MIIISTKNIKIITGFVFAVMALTIYNPTAIASATQQTVRVFYRPDGGVSVTIFISGACRGGETETECMDRISDENPGTVGLPYDDMTIDQLPQSRENRDKWRGEKGKGIRIDHSLVTKTEKIEELEKELDAELDKTSPNAVKIAKIQRLQKKVLDIDHSVLTADDLALFEEKKKGFLAAAVEVVGDLLTGIFDGLKNGLLAIRNLIIGSPEAPSGVTIYDVVTKQPYCSVVASGQTLNIPGVCTPELIQNYLNPSSAVAPTSDVQNITDPNSGTSEVQNIEPISGPASTEPTTTTEPPPSEPSPSEPVPTEPVSEPAPTEPTPSEPAPELPPG